MTGTRRKALLGVGLGVGVGLAAAVALWLGLHIHPLLALAIGAASGAGTGLLTRPGAPRRIERITVTPTTTAGLLDAAADSAGAMSQALARLTSQQLWAGSRVDERIGEILAGIRNLAATPALRSRAAADGDVQTLYLLAGDYLPTLVNLAIENDRMHATFRGAASRAEVVRNVAALDEQSAILGEALERIESDVAKGVSRDADQHAAFLAARFEQASTNSLLDLKQPGPVLPGTLPQNGEHR